MENNVSAIILKVEYPALKTAEVRILGKSCLEWVALALPDCNVMQAVFTDSVELPILIRPYVDTTSKYTVVLYSDTPLITKKTVLNAIATLEASDSNVLKMTRGYVFKTAFILGAEKLYTDNVEYFDEEDFITAFNFKQVALISDVLKNRILNYHMERGVHFEDVNSTFVDCDVVIGKNVVIGPNNILKGKTIIKDNVRMLMGNVIEDCIIDEGVKLNSSQAYESFIGKNTTVGPFAFIRPKSVIGADCRIGDFVEIKKSVIGDGCKVSHLSYVGDCEMGNECNIGCGVVFVNYDGKDKFKSIVGRRVFIGSNSNVIAPVVIEDNAFIAAGSTITDNVPDSALAIARARQTVKPDWQGNKYKKS